MSAGHRNQRASEPARAARTELVLLALLVALALGVRLVRLGAESLWYDEAFSVSVAQRPLARLVEALVADGRHPPLSFLVLKGSLALLARAPLEIAARAPSVLASCVELVLAWCLGRRLASPRIALLGVCLLALAQLSVRQAQEARMYALASCLITGSALLVARALLEGRVRALVAAGFVAGLALMTHYWTAFSLAALLAWSFALRRAHPLPVRAWLGAGVACALVCAPWLVVALGAQAARASELLAEGAPAWGRVGWSTLVVAPALFAGGEQPRLGPEPAAWALGAAWLLVLAPALLAAAASVRARADAASGGVGGDGAGAVRARAASPDERECVLGTALLAFAPIALTLAASVLVGAQFAVRYLLPALPPTLLLSARGLLALRPRALRFAALVALLAFSLGGLVATWRGGWKPAWRPLVAELAARAEPGDCVLWLPAGVEPLQWRLYAPGREAPRALRPELADAEACARVWLVAYAGGANARAELERARRALAATHREVHAWSEPPLELTGYARR